jgi:protocatechuate 3,4-dioxygenase beta subunit
MSSASIIQLVKPEEKGSHIVLTGRVLRPDCRNPVVNAIVDVWQANAKGMYDIKTPDEVIAPANYYICG